MSANRTMMELVKGLLEADDARSLKKYVGGESGEVEEPCTHCEKCKAGECCGEPGCEEAEGAMADDELAELEAAGAGKEG